MIKFYLILLTQLIYVSSKLWTRECLTVSDPSIRDDLFVQLV